MRVYLVDLFGGSLCSFCDLQMLHLIQSSPGIHGYLEEEQTHGFFLHKKLLGGREGRGRWDWWCAWSFFLPQLTGCLSATFSLQRSPFFLIEC
jgi:hypothetical protein